MSRRNTPLLKKSCHDNFVCIKQNEHFVHSEQLPSNLELSNTSKRDLHVHIHIKKKAMMFQLQSC